MNRTMSLQYLQDMLFLEADEYLQQQIRSQFAVFEEDGALRVAAASLAYATLQQAKQYIFEELQPDNRLRFLRRFLADSAVSRRIKHEDVAKAQADEKPAEHRRHSR